MKSKMYYKVTRPDGWDNYTGETINYRKQIGKRVVCPSYKKGQDSTCCSSGVIHASEKVLDALSYCNIPCAIFKVKGTPIVVEEDKCGFRSFIVVEEITPEAYDELLGFKYSEVVNSINPLLIDNEVSKNDIELLKKWASVSDSVRASVWDSVGASVWDSVSASVSDSVWASVSASVSASVRASVWASVWDLVRAYIGSMFELEQWKYINHEKGIYPFQCGVELWKRGFIPIRYDNKWHLWKQNGGVVYTLEVGE